MADAQRGYLELVTGTKSSLPLRNPAIEAVASALRESGEGLVAAAKDDARVLAAPGVRTRDGYVVQPWIVLVQAVNHAHDHRRQVCGMLRALCRTAPRLDGWGFGEAVGAVVQER